MKLLLFNLIPPSSGTRFPALDGLRGLACLAVAAGHLHLLYPRMNEGFSGGAVAVFYVLSAFLLSYPWFIGKPIKPGSYYVRRLFRIWPAYLVSLLLSLWLYATLNSPLPSGSFWAHFFFLQSFKTDWVYSLNIPLWSLAPEVHFYILLPFLGLAAVKFPKHFFVVALPALLAIQLFVVLSGMPKSLILNLPYLLLPFVLGILAAYLVSHPKSYYPAFAPAGLLGLLAFAAILWGIQNRFSINKPLFYFLLSPRGVFTSACSALAIIGLASVKSGLSYRLFSFRLVRLVGIAGYGIFIFHSPLSALIKHSFGWSVAQIATIPVSIIVGILSYFLIEAPCVRLSHKIKISPPLLVLFSRLFPRSNTSSQAQSALPYSPAADPDTTP